MSYMLVPQVMAYVQTRPKTPGVEGPDDDGALSDSERALAKGMSRRTMCGPPLLDHIQAKVDMPALLVRSGQGHSWPEVGAVAS